MRKRNGGTAARTLTNLLVGLVFGLLPIVSNGQNMCPIKTIQAKSLNGIVVENLDRRVPLPDVTVELRYADKEEQLMAATKTDSDGAFRFDVSRKGKFYLDFKTEFFPSYRLVIKIKESKNHTKGGGFVVKLGLDCGKNEVLLGK